MNRPRDDQFVMPSLRLDGRVALVTGGSRGLGLGMALALAHAGADVALAARGGEELAGAAGLIERAGRRALAMRADMTETQTIPALVKGVADHFGRLDILVNAAGINLRQPAESFTPEDWDRVMAVNLRGAFFAAQAAAPLMRAQGKGKIINVGSIVFERTVPNSALYAMSKNGLRGMTSALAVEWAPHRINVNAIAPGRFWTQMTDRVFSDPALYQSAVGVIPLGRPGVAADLAGATVLFASDAGDYITGQTLFVDGGWVVSGGIKA